MFRKIFFPVSLIALFMLAGSVAAQPKGDGPDCESKPEKNSVASTNVKLLPFLPLDNTSPIAGHMVEFSWTKLDSAAQYRLEIEEANGKAVLTVALPLNTKSHGVPSSQIYRSKDLRWRVVALNQAGSMIAETAWRILLAPSSECED
ncbi:MAG: hypothetical protein ACREOI_14270 [bacterium]